MPIQVQVKMPELGRIRIGARSERGLPTKLTKFRLTSKDRAAIMDAAQVYGGHAKPWAGHEGEWEVFTNADELAILVAPDPISQWYELWAGGMCKRRCDGVLCSIPDPDPKVEGMKQVDCTCDPNERECGIKTRASFILPDLPGLGRWRLDTGSFYAATELPGQIELLQAFKLKGLYPEAVLALETRRVVRQKNGRPETRVFSVVTIRFRETIRQLMGSGGSAGPEVQQIAAAQPQQPKAIQGQVEFIGGQGNGEV